MSTTKQVIRRWAKRLKCADCGTVLNTSVVFEDLEALRRAWTTLCFSGPLVSGICPNKCRSTFSDCNVSTTSELFDADTNEVFDLRNRRLDELPRTREVVV